MWDVVARDAVERRLGGFQETGGVHREEAGSDGEKTRGAQWPALGQGRVARHPREGQTVLAQGGEKSR